MNHLRTIVTWFCMGLADLIPWVSWGTIAFISGLYERLITSISHFDKKFLHHLFSGKIKKLWYHIDGWFLVALFWGILLAIAIWSWVISWALASHPVLVNSFFVWLVLMSILMLLRDYPFRTRQLVVLFVAWLVFWNMLTSTLQFTLPWGLLGLFFAWVLGSIAMVLPWISWSYILLIVWAYERVINHIDGLVEWLKAMDSVVLWTHIWPVVSIGLWVVLWIVVMSKILKWALKKWHNQIILFLIGLMTGALPTLVPDMDEIKAQWALVSVCFVVGVVLIWMFFSLQSKRK